MEPLFRKLTALMVIFSMAFSGIGCTTMTPTLLTKPGNVAKQIKAGDTIRYRTAFGESEVLKVESVQGERILGTNNGQDKVVMIADVKSIKKKGFSILKTAGLVLLIAIGTAALAEYGRQEAQKDAYGKALGGVF